MLLTPDLKNKIVLRLRLQKCLKHKVSPKITFASNQEILFKCCCSDFEKHLQIVKQQLVDEMISEEFFKSLRESNDSENAI